MNKKTLGFTTILVLGVGALYLWYKKEKKQLESEEKAIDEELNELGVSSEKLREEVDSPEDDGNLVKALYTGIAFNPNWDVNTVDIEECLGTQCLIHLGQHEKRNSKKLFQELDILFEIPEYPRNTNFHSPRIADYIRGFKDVAETLWENLAKFSNRPFTKLVGYLELTGEINGEEATRYVEIPAEVYQDYIERAEGHNIGLSLFYEDSYKHQISEETKEKLAEWIQEKDIDGEFDNVPQNPCVVLMYRITFPIQNRYSKYGINFKSALEILRYLTYSGEFFITKKGDSHSEEIAYENIIFHPSKDDGWYDMSKYYTVNSSKHVVIDSI